jgi:hypothetical protein
MEFYSTYSVDTGSFEVVDSQTFIANLNQSIDWDQELVSSEKKKNDKI